MNLIGSSLREHGNRRHPRENWWGILVVVLTAHGSDRINKAPHPRTHSGQEVNAGIALSASTRRRHAPAINCRYSGHDGPDESLGPPPQERASSKLGYGR